ncbi:MAG: DUF4815 domain-containing protein [Paracoccus sp. (in: a-proteobacteria)]
MKEDKKNDVYNNLGDHPDITALAYRAGRVIQSSEMNALQTLAHQQRQKINDVLFKSGDVVAGGTAVLDPDTGALTIEAGNVYLRGSIFTVPAQTLTIATTGVVTIGVWLSERYLTESDDPTLLNPAIGTRGEGEPGAWRVLTTAQWGLSTDNNDGEFYAVYTAKNGYLNAKEPPPHITSLTQAVAKYDVDSTGSQYVVEGMDVHIAPDHAGKQVLVIDAGKARIGGYSIVFPASRRFAFAALPTTATVENEYYLATGGEQTIKLNRTPIKNVQSVSVRLEKTVDIIHDNFANSTDTLPDASVEQILEVRQDATVYAENTDWQLISGAISWAASGAEPATGSTYQVTYIHIATVAPIATTADTLTIAEGVAGKPVLVDYEHYLQRYDRLCLDSDGEPHLIKGVAGVDRILPPQVPPNLLLLATIKQDYLSHTRRELVLDCDRLVKMATLNLFGERLDFLSEEVARTRLEQSANQREASATHGVFADPFISNQFRDAGQAQNAVVAGGRMTLPITTQSLFFNVGKQTLDTAPDIVINQEWSSECMLINPYAAFDPLPAMIELQPAIDRWTTTVTTTDNQLIEVGDSVWNGGFVDSQSESVQLSTSKAIYCRAIKITVTASGFGGGEIVDAVTFDDIAVSPQGTIVANNDGQVTFNFTVPSDVPAGQKAVVVTGKGGSTGEAIFTSDGTIVNQLITKTTTRRFIRRARVDPLAQTFTLEQSAQICALDLFVCAKGNKPIRVQITETLVGIPTQTVIAEARLHAGELATDGSASQFIFSDPVFLSANVEYALVVMSDEPTPSVRVARLGGFDDRQQRWITAQPYTIGTLLSSSNASTWTPHNDKDLMFTLYRAKPTNTDKTVNVAEDLELINVTDLIVFIDGETVSADTAITANLLLENGNAHVLSDGQHLQFTQPQNQLANLDLTLSGNHLTPVIYGDVQLLLGTLEPSANYITRAIPAGLNSRVRVLVDAFLPAGSTLTVEASGDGGAWQACPQIASRQIDLPLYELTFECGTLIDAGTVAVQLTLTGSASARAYLENLRVLVMEG